MTIPDDDIQPEYSLKGGIRGKYADRYARSTGEGDEPPEDEEKVEAEAHERWLAYQRGEIDAISEEESIADLEERLQRVDTEQAWAAEAHRRWEACLRGEEEMLPFEEVMAEIRGRRERSEQNPEQ